MTAKARKKGINDAKYDIAYLSCAKTNRPKKEKGEQAI